MKLHMLSKAMKKGVGSVDNHGTNFRFQVSLSMLTTIYKILILGCLLGGSWMNFKISSCNHKLPQSSLVKEGKKKPYSIISELIISITVICIITIISVIFSGSVVIINIIFF